MPEPRQMFRCLGIALAAGLVVVPEGALACRCLTRSQAAAARTADAVVLADVETGAATTALSKSYRVRVVESWKHPLSGTLEVTTERTSCMAELTAGRRYLLYLQRSGLGYSTQACAGNLPARQATTVVRRLRRTYR